MGSLIENAEAVPGAGEDEDEGSADSPNKPAMMSNDDSFTNIAPAKDTEEDQDDGKLTKSRSTKKIKDDKRDRDRDESKVSEKEETKGKDLPNKVSQVKKLYDIDETVIKIRE